MHVIDTLAPIFLVVALGAVLRRTGFVRASFFRGTNRLVYWVGLPCLLLAKTATAKVAGSAALSIFVVLLGGVLACVATAYVLGWLFGMSWPSRGAFVQGSFRGNLAYVGLPVILYALAAPNGGAKGEIEALAVLAFAPLVPLHNAGAVLVLLIGQEGKEARLREQLRVLLGKVVTNPLLLACVVGMLYAATGLPLPSAVHRALSSTGQMALPLALLGIGATLELGTIRGNLGWGFMAAAIKLLLAPAAGFLLARAMGLSPDQTLIAMVHLGCPTAVTSYVMAEQLGGDADLAAGIVMLTTLLAFPTLAAVLLVAPG